MLGCIFSIGYERFRMVTECENLVCCMGMICVRIKLSGTANFHIDPPQAIPFCFSWL